MGQVSSSVPLTSLTLVLNHFKEFKQRAQGYGEPVHPGRLHVLASLEWHCGASEWPSVGSFNMAITEAVQRYIFGPPTHPDQIVYIQIWIDLIFDSPPWLRKVC